jgi:hypothetical protein
VDTLKTGQDVLAILPEGEEWEDMNERFHLPVVTELAAGIDRRGLRAFQSALPFSPSSDAAIEVSLFSREEGIFAINLVSDFGRTRVEKGDDRLVAQWPSIAMTETVETLFPNTEVVEKLT